MGYFSKRALNRCPSTACACIALLLLLPRASGLSDVQTCHGDTCTNEKLSADVLDIADESGPYLLQTKAQTGAELQRLTSALAKRVASSDLAKRVASYDHGQHRIKSQWAEIQADLAIKLEDLKGSLDLARTTSEVQASLFQESSRYLDNITREEEGIQARSGRDMQVLEKAAYALQEATRLIMGFEASQADEFAQEAGAGKDLLASIKDLERVWKRHAKKWGREGADAMEYAITKASVVEKAMDAFMDKHNADMRSVKDILLDAADAAKVIRSMTQEHHSGKKNPKSTAQTVAALKTRVGDYQEASKAIGISLADATEKIQDTQRAFKQSGGLVVQSVTKLQEKEKEANAETAAAQQDVVQAEQATAEAMRINQEALLELSKLRALNKDLEAQLQAALTQKSKMHHQMEYMKTQLDFASSQLRNPQEALNILSESGTPSHMQEETNPELPASHLTRPGKS